jgi:hypothetical protein
MNARKTAAQFAAYVWYNEVRSDPDAAEANQFAKKNWNAFAAVAPVGLGRLLHRIARRTKPGGKRRFAPRTLAKVG